MVKHPGGEGYQGRDWNVQTHLLCGGGVHFEEGRGSQGRPSCGEGEGRKGWEGQREGQDESSSHGGSEAQATEGAAGEEPGGGNIAGLEALATVVMKLQEEEETGEAAELEEWLAAGPQAPEPDPGQRTCKRSTGDPAAGKVKKTTTKASKAEAACRQSPRLAQTKASSAKRPTDMEAESNPRSGSSSSQSSSSPDLLMSR